jgi:Flp pilus assembly protein CpaB
MADNPQVVAHRRNWRQISLTMWAALAVFVAGALGGISLGIYGTGSESVVVATHDLPAYHAVSASDVSLRKMAGSAIPRGAIGSLAAVLGHYLLTSLDGGEVVVQDAVGPPAAVAAAGMVVVPLPVANDSSAWVRKGALVDLLLAPAGQGGSAVVIPRVEVVDDQKTATGGHLVFFAVPRGQETAIAQVTGRGQAVLAVPSGGP